MRYMILVMTTETDSSFDAAALRTFGAQLDRAGVLLDAAVVDDDGLYPTARTQAGSLGGYAVIEARSPEEALEWARRYPKPSAAGAPSITVRRLRAPAAATPIG